MIFESILGPDASQNSKICPGVCVPSAVSNFCPKIFEEVQCATPNTKCCVRKTDALFSGNQPITQAPNRNTQAPNRITADFNLDAVDEDIIIKPEVQSSNHDSVPNSQAITSNYEESYQPSYQPSISNAPSVPSVVSFIVVYL